MNILKQFHNESKISVKEIDRFWDLEPDKNVIYFIVYWFLKYNIIIRRSGHLMVKSKMRHFGDFSSNFPGHLISIILNFFFQLNIIY